LIDNTGLRRVGEQLIENRDYLSAADHIRYVLAQENNLTGYLQALRQAVEGPPGDRYAPSRLFDHLLNLDPKVVFTTNYDKLFERASKGGFRLLPVTTTSLGDELRRREPVFIKLHGSTDDIADVVLTRTDFSSVTKVGRDVFDTLKGLAMTSTILFVGYSLDDPDMQLILQAVGRPGLTPEAHFLLAPKPASASRIDVFKESFGVSVLTYTGAHSKVTRAIKDLADQVAGIRAGNAAP